MYLIIYIDIRLFILYLVTFISSFINNIRFNKVALTLFIFIITRLDIINLLLKISIFIHDH